MHLLLYGHTLTLLTQEQWYLDNNVSIIFAGPAVILAIPSTTFAAPMVSPLGISLTRPGIKDLLAINALWRSSASKLDRCLGIHCSACGAPCFIAISTFCGIGTCNHVSILIPSVVPAKRAGHMCLVQRQKQRRSPVFGDEQLLVWQCSKLKWV